jgi:hypothetical protein
VNRKDSIHSVRKELAHRNSDGIDVWLLWSPAADELFVVVHDRRVDELFELEVDACHALDAFEHPYAHAAFRGVDYGAKVLTAAA